MTEEVEIVLEESAIDDLPLEELVAYEGDEAEVAEALAENTTNEGEAVEDGDAEEQQDGGFAA